MIVGFIASPILEYTKAYFSRRNEERASKRNLVVLVRVILGYFEAFVAYLNHADGISDESHEREVRNLVAWRAMKTFDLSPVFSKIEGLATFDLPLSMNSGVGQSLIARTLTVLHAFEQTKSINLVKTRKVLFDEISNKNLIIEVDTVDFEGANLLDRARTLEQDLRLFVEGPYSKVLGIRLSSTIYDPNISDFDRVVSEAKMAEFRRKQAALMAKVASQEAQREKNRGK